MSARRVIKVAGAVVAAAALGQLPAHAAIDLVSGAGSVTYARETLTTPPVDATDTGDDTDYYEVTAPAVGETDDDLLSFKSPVGRAVPLGGTIQVEYRLSGMVFNGATLDGTALEIADETPAVITATEGAEGDNKVVFTITADTAPTGAIRADAVMTLDIRSLAVSADRPGRVSVGTKAGTGGGSFEGFLAARPAVRVASALKEGATPISPVVKMADNFRTFPGGSLVASVGKISIGLETGDLLVASDSSEATLADLIDAAVATGVTFKSSAATGTALGFAKAAFLSTKANCSGPRTDVASGSPLAWITTATAALSPATVNDKHLCIEVSGTTAIPATVPYQAVVSYGPADAAAAFPAGNVNLVLGKIVRDGVTVNIPFVDTHANVNFRIVLTNRGSEQVPYKFDFTPPDGTFAVGTDVAEGMLEPNSFTLIRAPVLVQVTGRRAYTAASLTVGAPREMVDIVTVQVNKLDGSTDTVRY